MNNDDETILGSPYYTARRNLFPLSPSPTNLPPTPPPSEYNDEYVIPPTTIAPPIRTQAPTSPKSKNRLLYGPLPKDGFPPLYNPKEKFLINLSRYKFSDIQKRILQRGFKFVPSPRKIYPQTFQKASERVIKCTSRLNFFRSNRESFEREPFTLRSNFVPRWSSLTRGAQLGITKIDNLTSTSYANPLPHKSLNMSNKERKELALMASPSFRKHTILQSADKGSAIVALTREDYISEALRQLSNTAHYRCLGPHSVFMTNREEIHAILSDLHAQNYISPKQLLYLCKPEEPRPRIFYLLPKIHKPPDKWPSPYRIPPGRPIVSDVSSESYFVSEYIDSFLQPLACSHPAYVKDSFHFIELVRKINLPPNSLLVTADVESMYTNISHDLGLKAIESCLDRNPDPTRPPTSQFLRLLEITLLGNDLFFDGKFYLQTCGTAMGKKYAPSYANIFMAEWERTIFQKTSLTPLIYKRYLDDIFMVWTHGRDTLSEFLSILNSDHPCIRLCAEISDTNINFLDITLFIRPQTPTVISTKVYHKPTDTMELLHHSSFHPKHTFAGIVKSQILRYHRLSSDKSDFKASCDELFSVLTKRGYTYRKLSTILANTLKQLENPLPNNVDQTRVPQPHPTLSRLTPNPPMARPCNHPLCKLCPSITPTNSYTSHSTQKTYPIPLNLSCTSKAVIYVITCLTCQTQYVGLTHNQLNHRFWNHRHAIRTLKDTALAKHMNDHPDPWDFAVTPIYQIPYTSKQSQIAQLREMETFFIKLLNTIDPHGLNSQLQINRPILPIVIPFSPWSSKWAAEVKIIWDAFFRQEFPTLLPHTPITAFSLGGKNLRSILTSSNIRPQITLGDEHRQDPLHQELELET